jgi:hypothetical protein
MTTERLEFIKAMVEKRRKQFPANNDYGTSNEVHLGFEEELIAEIEQIRKVRPGLTNLDHPFF